MRLKEAWSLESSENYRDSTAPSLPRECIGIPGFDQNAGNAINDRLADGPHRRRHHGQPAGHRLHDALGHAFLSIGWQDEEIERVQLLLDVVLVAAKPDAVTERQSSHLLFKICTLRTVADDEQLPDREPRAGREKRRSGTRGVSS